MVGYLKAKQIMSMPGFAWKPGMLAYSWGDYIRVTSVVSGIPGILHQCYWTNELDHLDIAHDPIIVYEDQETSNILDNILPNWKTIIILNNRRFNVFKG
jgi:hypothetical protein